MISRRAGAAVVALVLAVGACGDDDSGPILGTTGTAPTTSQTSPITMSPSGETFDVTLDGVVWAVPVEGCGAATDPQAASGAAAAVAEEVRLLVRDRASGWPTTTAARPEDDAAFLAIELLGPLALALGDITDTADALAQRWTDFEAGYANPSEGWGPVTEITRRLPAWRAIAARLVPEIVATCQVATGDLPIPSATDADLRWVEGGALGRGGSLTVPVGSDDMSLLAYARTGDPDAQVFITAVIDPAGRDVMDAIGLEYGELSNFGEAAVYLPIRREVALEPGDYRIDFEATGDLVSSGAIVRSGDPDVAQRIDVVFWMATTVDFDRAALEARFRSVGDQLLGPHGIEVGAMTFLDPPPDVVARYSVLRFTESGTDEDLRALCREMSTETGPVRALEFAIVDRLDGDDPDSVIEGSSSGLPGTAMLSGSDLSCVAGMAAVDPDFGGRDLFDRAIVIWHEAGHHLGLYHTTEGDGALFDLLDDTPECPISRDANRDGYVDVYECSGLDADNFMFYDGDGTEMTDDQAWSIRRHPLLYPVG